MGVWGTLAGHLGRLGSLLGIARDVLGTFEAGIRAVWVALGDGLGSPAVPHKGLGESSGGFEGFARGLGLLLERPRSTLTAFLCIKNVVPKTTENRLSKPVRGPKAHFGRQLGRNHWF